MIDGYVFTSVPTNVIPHDTPFSFCKLDTNGFGYVI